jgi:hypothetical protein
MRSASPLPDSSAPASSSSSIRRSKAADGTPTGRNSSQRYKKHASAPPSRLDRLARNVAFIANLMESGVDFIACDMPHATRLTIHILAAVAEHEREMISKRTKGALAEAKRHGTKLGHPRIEEARALALAAHHAKRPTLDITAMIESWRHEQ